MSTSAATASAPYETDRAARSARRNGWALVPHAAGAMTFAGPIEALVAMPPAPDAPVAVEFDSY